MSETFETVEKTEPVETNEEPAVTVTLEDLQAQIAKLTSENDKLKKAQSSASSDAAEWKKKFRATQDEATRAEAERKEMLERIQEENKLLKRNQAMAEQKAGWLALGMDEESAAKAAEATIDSNFTNLMDTMKNFMVNHDKTLVADAIKRTPAPVTGKPAQSITKEQFDKMGYGERLDVFNNFPDLYAEFTK